MANLSDLLASAAPDDKAPGWMAALRDHGDFVEGIGWATSRPTELPTKADAFESAIAEAFAKGEAAGQQAAQSELAERGQRQDALRLAFCSLDTAARDAFANGLAQTVLALCEPVLVESAVDADALTSRCREAARRFASAAGAFTLRLHPQDLDMLDPEMLKNWEVESDDTLERGSIRLEDGEGSLADGPDEWRSAIAAAIGA